MPSLRVVPALRDNYIWLLADAPAGTALAVDPGEAGPVVQALQRDGLQLTAIFLTHHHADHIGGAAELARRYPRAVVYAPRDRRIELDARRVGGGDTVEVASPAARFAVIEVHGHTRTHVAYYGEGLLFSGDTLFSLGCGRLFEGTPAEMLDSLDRLAQLPGETRVCCGHEYTLANAAFALTVEPHNPALLARTERARGQRLRGEPTLPSRIDEERAANPFLRVDRLADDCVPWPDPAARTHDRTGRFAALRSAKDHYRA